MTPPSTHLASPGGKVAVTGAAGQLGVRVAEQLLELRGPGDVVLITRRPASLQRFADMGVRVRYADLNEPEGLSAAFAGVDRLLVISTTHESTPHRVQQHQGAFTAARRAGVRHLAFTSMPKVDREHPSGLYAQEYVQSEQDLRDAGVDWTVLQIAPYADYLIGRLALAISKGRLISNAGQGRISPISHIDCGAVAARVLTDDGHANKAYLVTGPELFTQSDLAALASEVTGRDLPVLELDDEAVIEQATADGIPAPMPTYLSAHLKAVRLGYFDDQTDVVEELTGRPAIPLRQVLEANRAGLLALV